MKSKAMTAAGRLPTAAMALMLLGNALQAQAAVFPGKDPGEASASQGNRELTLSNNVIELTWRIDGGAIVLRRIKDRLSGFSVEGRNGDLFRISLSGGEEMRASEMSLVGSPKVLVLQPDQHAPRLADRSPGRAIGLKLRSANGSLEAGWQAELRDGANYVKTSVAFKAVSGALAIKDIELIRMEPSGAAGSTFGTVPGSPVVVRTMFFGYLHPLSENVFENGSIRCSLSRNLPIEAGDSLTQSSMVGVAPEGQLRRGFLYAMERERAHPYRPFLHYNSWWDIVWANLEMNEKDCLDSMEAIGKELFQNRGVPIDAFVLDAGWDDHASLWNISKEGFPDGFAPLKELARRFNSHIGIWLSPRGGYDSQKPKRIKFGIEQGFETNEEGTDFLLSGPVYYQRFRERCAGMARSYGVNYFKFDGIHDNLKETEALLRLIADLRKDLPHLYFNITTGTWPSPFWLCYGDSIWRGGKDIGWAGPGEGRERWITFRDGDTFTRVVSRAPLYPLNSLMVCSLINGKLGGLRTLEPTGQAFLNEIVSAFGSGNSLQELYISPGRLDKNAWDALAEAAVWWRDNRDVLVDTSWVGGDPTKGEIYGWASWSPRKGILTLRCPDVNPGTISLDIGQVFELPVGAPQSYVLHSPWKKDSDREPLVLKAGRPHRFLLQPFEVLVFDAVPVRVN